MLRYLQDYDFAGKKVLIRVDFNVPLDAHAHVTDATRIHAAVPTIKTVLAGGGAAILLSHLGRPKQANEQRFSLQHLLPCLTHILGVPIEFAQDCIGPEAQKKVQQLALRKVLLLENVRFQTGETTADSHLAQSLATLGDVYINDAFGTAHRPHTSTTLVAHYSKEKLAGLLMKKELEYADRILKKAEKPFIAIIGGNKIADKLPPLVHLLDQLDCILVGGGIANTLQKALGGQVGDALVEDKQIAQAQHLIQCVHAQGVRLIWPRDMVIALRAAQTITKTEASGRVPIGWMALDIGPQTQQEFTKHIKTAKTILWCGPMGVFELANFRQGTAAVAKAVVQATHQGAFSLVGGGDSAAAVRQLGYADQVSHVSTGGGALLAYLSGIPLPGIVSLQEAT